MGLADCAVAVGDSLDQFVDLARPLPELAAERSA